MQFDGEIQPYHGVKHLYWQDARSVYFEGGPEANNKLIKQVSKKGNK